MRYASNESSDGGVTGGSAPIIHSFAALIDFYLVASFSPYRIHVEVYTRKKNTLKLKKAHL